jgi:hypothetical protein
MNIKNIFPVILLLVFANSMFCFGQNSSNCKCKYYSNYPREKILQQIDSIKNSFLNNQKYDGLTYLGIRAYNAASCLFITKSDNKYIGFFYDFMSSKNMVYTGNIINNLVKYIIENQSYIEQISIIDVPESQKLYDDYGYIISTTKSIKYVEMCISQLLYANAIHANTGSINNILNLYSELENEFRRENNIP